MSASILPMAIMAREHGTELYIAPPNVDEALLIDGLKVFAVANLAPLVRHLTEAETLTLAMSHAREKKRTLRLPMILRTCRGSIRRSVRLRLRRQVGIMFLWSACQVWGRQCWHGG